MHGRPVETVLGTKSRRGHFLYLPRNTAALEGVPFQHASQRRLSVNVPRELVDQIWEFVGDVHSDKVLLDHISPTIGVGEDDVHDLARAGAAQWRRPHLDAAQRGVALQLLRRVRVDAGIPDGEVIKRTMLGRSPMIVGEQTDPTEDVLGDGLELLRRGALRGLDGADEDLTSNG